MPEEPRGVSAPLGVALLFAVVLSGMIVVVTVGAGALDETRERMNADRAEKVLTQFDSRSAVVALGETKSQEVPLAAPGESEFAVRSDAGWMNVTVTSGGTVREVVNVTLGAVRYANGETVIAYQGGGVWQGTAGGSTMVSPPEFHFRAQTLTLPIVSVDGDANLGETATVTRDGTTSVRFPNASDHPDFVNPLKGEQVNVTVHSDYYRAWAEYFERRTDGNATLDHANETATAELVVPFDEEYDNIIATTQPGGITVNGNDDPPDPHETGVDYPLADARIEAQVEECETNASACADVDSVGTITSPGTYFDDQSFSGTLDVDSPGGNVTVVVDGNFQPSSVSIDMNDDYATTVLVRNSFSMNANTLNGGGPAGNFVVAVHSNGAINGNGKYQFRGLLYAPGSDCNLNGGGPPFHDNVIGGVVCETVTINGNPNKFVYDSSIESTALGLGDDGTKITFLHVTVNRVDVSSE